MFFFNYPQAAYICRSAFRQFPEFTYHIILVNLFEGPCRPGTNILAYLAGVSRTRATLLEFAHAFGSSVSETRTALAAADLGVDHKLQFWDGLILTAAAEAGCALLLSEDMLDGFVTRGLTVINPLRDTRHPKLARLFGPSH